MPRSNEGGTEWIKRHKRSLIGSVSGGSALVGLLAFAPDYAKVRDTAAVNAQHIAQLDKRLEDQREVSRRQWEKISIMQMEIERLKAKQER